MAVGVAFAAPLKQKLNVIKKIKETEEAISTIKKIIDGAIVIVEIMVSDWVMVNNCNVVYIYILIFFLWRLEEWRPSRKL